MFNLTGSEIIVILLLALVVLGPEKLPDAIRRFGRTYAELKKMGTGFQQEFKAALDEPVREMRETADLIRKSADFTGTQDPAPAKDAQTGPNHPMLHAAPEPAPVPTEDVPFAPGTDGATSDDPIDATNDAAIDGGDDRPGTAAP